MLAHNAIIITAGRVQGNIAEFDQLVATLCSQGKTPIAILGPDGDDLLGSTREIERIEIIFDPNFEGDVFSSVKAGLELTENPAYVFVLGERHLDQKQWARLEDSLRETDSQIHRLIPVTQDSETHYPQLLTKNGVRSLRHLAASTSWSDSQAFWTSKIDLSIGGFGHHPDGPANP